MTEEKVLKIPFAGRMDPDLKRELTAEAEKRNMTLSSYIELRLKEGKDVENEMNRRISRLEQLMPVRSLSVYDDYEEEEDENEEIAQSEEEEALLERIEEVETENSKLQTTVGELTKENETLKSDLTAQPFRFAAEDLEEADTYITYIAKKYPELSREKLIVAVLYAEARSLKTGYFSGYSVKDYVNNDREKRINRFSN